jgi:hypothetical protein
MTPRNHLSKAKRLRRFRRMTVMASKRCGTCRRILDPAFRYDRDGTPHCSRHY